MIRDPNRSGLGPLLFNHNLDGGIKNTLSKFTNDTSLEGAMDIVESRATLQRHCNKMEEELK